MLQYLMNRKQKNYWSDSIFFFFNRIYKNIKSSFISIFYKDARYVHVNCQHMWNIEIHNTRQYNQNTSLKNPS